MSKRIDKFLSYLELGLAVWWIYGAVITFFTVPQAHPSPFFDLLMGQTALYAYAALFLFTGLALIYSKVKHKKRLKSNVLVVMYLTAIYTFFLTVATVGFSWGVLMPILAGSLSALCWLRWKFKTEYIDLKTFHENAVNGTADN